MLWFGEKMYLTRDNPTPRNFLLPDQNALWGFNKALY